MEEKTQVYPSAPPSYDEAMSCPPMAGSTMTSNTTHFSPTIPISNYGTLSSVTTTQPIQPEQTTVIVREIVNVNGCPVCRIGMLESQFTCIGIFCAIFFFPLGILCCLACKDKICTNCGAHY